MSSTTAISPVSIDTNILIYSIDYSDPVKQEIADTVVERLIAARGCMPLQCLSEFYALIMRKRLITPQQAERVVERMLMSLVIVPSEALDVVQAMHLTTAAWYAIFRRAADCDCAPCGLHCLSDGRYAAWTQLRRDHSPQSVS